MRSMVEGRPRMTGVPPIVHTARKLRRGMSLPEGLLWRALRQRPDGVRFRRQHLLGDYVLDFYCSAARLAVEVDGRAHEHGDGAVRDVRRDAWLAERGITCVRVTAAEVLADPAAVAAGVAQRAVLRQVAPPLHHAAHGPPPRGAGRNLAVGS